MSSDVQTLLNAKKVRLEEIKVINDRLHKLGVVTIPKKKMGLMKPKPAPKSKAKAASHQVPILATVSSMKLYLTSQDVKYNASATKAELETIIREHFLVRKVNEFHKKQVAGK